MGAWVFVAILLIGVVVTIVGVRLGGRTARDHRFGPDASAEETPPPFTSRREPAIDLTLEGTRDLETAIPARPGPEASIEERLRAAAAARSATAAPQPRSVTRDTTSSVEVTTDADAPSHASDPGAAATTGVEGTARATRPTLALRRLDDDRRAALDGRWAEISERLIASPEDALDDADTLVRDLLEARGLPRDPEDAIMPEAAVAYPDIVDPFRLATAISEAARDGRATPAQLRQAAYHYRDAAERLLANDAAAVP